MWHTAHMQMPAVVDSPLWRSQVLAFINDERTQLTWQHARELFIEAFHPEPRPEGRS